MRKKKFYALIIKSVRSIGVLYAPENVDTQFGTEVEPVIGPCGMTFELRKGDYAPYMASNVSARFISFELKELFEEFLPDNYPLEFIPMKIKSERFGDKTYYIPHFKVVFDVIDVKHSKVIPETGVITVPCIDYEKAKDLDIFNNSAYFDSVVVSDRVKSEMKKRELDVGIQFWEWHSI